MRIILVLTLLGLLLLYRWGKNSSDPLTKKKSRIVSLSIITAIVLGTITDVLLSSLFSELPQMATVIMMIPILSIYHVLQNESFGKPKGWIKKPATSLFSQVFLSTLYFLPCRYFFQRIFLFSHFGRIGHQRNRVQIQMFISIYLVLKENRPGYITSVLMNFISLISAIAYLMRYESSESLPGIISYLGVL